MVSWIAVGAALVVMLFLALVLMYQRRREKELEDARDNMKDILASLSAEQALGGVADIPRKVSLDLLTKNDLDALERYRQALHRWEEANKDLEAKE